MSDPTSKQEVAFVIA